VAFTEEKLKVIFDNCHEGIWELSPDGITLSVNQRLIELFGYQEPAEMIGRKIYDFMPEEWHVLARSKLQNHDTTRSSTYDFLFRDSTRRELWLNVALSPISEGGQLKSLLAFCSDLTRVKEKHALTESIQHIARIGGWEMDVVSGQIAWTDETYRIHGVPIGTPTNEIMELDFYSPHERERALKFINHCLQGQVGQRETFEFFDAHDQRKFVAITGEPIFDMNKKVIKLRGTFQDVTESVLRENRMQELLEYNRAIHASAKLSIITTDLTRLITGFNEEAERILGYTAAEMIGRKTPSVFHDPGEVERHAQKLKDELGVDVPVGFETFIFKARMGKFDESRWTYISKTGKRTQVLLSVTPLHNRNQQLSGYMGIAKDLTHELEIQKELETQKAMATHTAKLASLGEMSAGIAHEINNPLAIIVANLDFIHRTHTFSEKGTRQMAAARRALDRISKIVTGLKRFSRSNETRQLDLVPLNRIVEDALTIVEPKIKRFDVSIDFVKGTSPNLSCDAVEIEQVVVNLVNNAIDAIKEQDKRWVRIETHFDGTSVILRVVDSGPGMSAEVEERIFQPFFTTKSIGEGTGLGLSICKGILESHKAKITVNRASGHTCFEVRFSAWDSANRT